MVKMAAVVVVAISWREGVALRTLQANKRQPEQPKDFLLPVDFQHTHATSKWDCCYAVNGKWQEKGEAKAQIYLRTVSPILLSSIPFASEADCLSRRSIQSSLVFSEWNEVNSGFHHPLARNTKEGRHRHRQIKRERETLSFRSWWSPQSSRTSDFSSSMWLTETWVTNNSTLWFEFALNLIRARKKWQQLDLSNQFLGILVCLSAH